DGTHGRELWQSDGTEAGTQMVADLNPSGDAFSSSSSQENPPSQIAAIGSAVVFRATDGTKTGLWRSQGAGSPIEYLSPLAFAKGTLVGAELYFSTTGGDVGKTDGTPAGTVLLKSGVTPGPLVGFGGQVFFIDQPSGSINEGDLWKTDGTPAGTQKLIGYPVEFSAVAAGSTKLFLFARRGGQREVWVSDGTPETTALLKEINPTEDDAADYLAVLGGKVLFRADDGNGPALWGSDGTAEGTALVNNATLVGDGLLDWYQRGVAAIATVGNKLFFSVSGSLWCSDGTSAGTRIVKAFGTSDADRIYGAAEGNGLLFFSVIESGTVSLWRSDGTPEGTVQLKQFSELDFGPRVLAVGGQVYVVTGTQAAYQFWRTDGTPEGTLPLFSLERGPNPPSGDFPRELTAVGDKLFFTYSDTTNGSELWVSDGTQAGTRLVKDLSQGEYGSDPYGLADLNGTLLFMVSTHSDGTYPAKGFSLWKSDGSADGTTLLAQFDYNINVSVELTPSQLTPFSSKAFFTAWDKDTGNELWVSDGTPAGTRQVTDINTVPDPHYGTFPDASKNRGSVPHSLTVLGGTLLFAANDGVHGDELWRSDGTAAGTVLVKDLYPGSIGAGIGEIRALPGTGRVAFAGSDGLSGIELWLSDGSASGTVQLADLAAGAPSSNPAVLLPTQQQLFLLADDGVVGSEPWALDLTTLPTGRTLIFLPLLRR
ncbi:MAG TPA: ELWxxDGT repeat protein, partial [Roseiflexaceae bacterium]|nr:ELWxxDGT repeat protein [Roseiflexaceae bacterium]